MSRSFPALVVGVGKNAAWVALDGESEPRVADLKRTAGERHMLLPGDRVTVRVLEDGRTLVEAREPRAFVLERRTAGGRSKAMAANVDTLVTVTALADPAPRTLLLDQLLAFAELQGIAALVLLTKPDLADPALASGLRAVYEAAGYTVVIANPKTGEGISMLRDLLHGRRSLLCGLSGVGKSSSFQALGGSGTIGEVSRHGLGRQTTTAARLFRLEDGFLIDSPGVAEFGLGAVTPQELAGGFREFQNLGRACRFSDCTHLREPGCAVREAVEAGAIPASRYGSFVRILEGSR